MRFSATLLSLSLLLAMALIMAACADLAIDNPNEPDTELVLAEPADVQALPGGAFSAWFVGVSDVDPWMALLTMGDSYTSSWGNFGMWVMSTLPRPSYQNALTAASDIRDIAEVPWYRFYSSIGTANDVLNRIDEGMIMGDEATTKMIEASSLMVKGLSHGYVGLIFDQGYRLDRQTQAQVVDLEIDPTDVELVPYNDVVEYAIDVLEQAMAAAEEADAMEPGITMPDGYINEVTLDAEGMTQLMSSYAARLLTYQARTASENEATDWERVLEFAEAGITEEFAPVGDNGINWYHLTQRYGNEPGWIRVDQRIIHMLDPDQPETFPSDGSTLPEAESDDERLEMYFNYNAAIPFPAARGPYHYGHYSRARGGETWFAGGQTVPIPEFIVAENDLIRAEALIRSGGSTAEAADLINNSRVDVGGLEALTGDESDDELLDAIYYERFIEVDYFGSGQAFMDRRRFDDLEPGTPQQLPLPALELNILDMEVYTFGGDAGQGGEGGAMMLALPGAAQHLGPPSSSPGLPR